MMTSTTIFNKPTSIFSTVLKCFNRSMLGLMGCLLLCGMQSAMAEEVQDSPLLQEGVVAEAVRIELLVVYATTENSAVDPQIRPLMKYFRNYKFTGFSLLDSQNAKLTDNTARTFTIEGNRKVIVTMLSHSEKSSKLNLVILEGKGKKILDTTVNISRNGTFIVAGPKYKDGVLFLPISAKY